MVIQPSMCRMSLSVTTPFDVPSCIMVTPIIGSLSSADTTVPLTLKLCATTDWIDNNTSETSKRVNLLILSLIHILRLRNAHQHIRGTLVVSLEAEVDSVEEAQTEGEVVCPVSYTHLGSHRHNGSERTRLLSDLPHTSNRLKELYNGCLLYTSRCV